MSNAQSDLDTIRAAWRVLPIHQGNSGSVIELRYARADIEGLREVLAALQRIEPAQQLNRELVAEVWGLPYYINAFIGAGQFTGDLKAELLALQQQFAIELHRILGTPQQIKNANPSAQG